MEAERKTLVGGNRSDAPATLNASWTVSSAGVLSFRGGGARRVG